MAIAGITIRTTPEAYESVRERLGRAPGVADLRETGTPCILAAVLEAGAEDRTNSARSAAGTA